jgi:RNA polymerase sigma-54 factor
VLVRKAQDKWIVELNDDSVPHLKINQQYAALGKGSRNEADN